MSEQDMLQDLLGDEYLLNWVVGNGGMSTVWLADDIENEREVAVKVLRPEFSDNVEFLSRFRDEALASEDIRNDNVVETYNYKEVTDDSGRTFCFIVMEFIRGESLADMLIRKGSLLEPDALDILEQAAHGLAAIHERGLVHRDIKPGNHRLWYRQGRGRRPTYPHRHGGGHRPIRVPGTSPGERRHHRHRRVLSGGGRLRNVGRQAAVLWGFLRVGGHCAHQPGTPGPPHVD